MFGEQKVSVWVGSIDVTPVDQDLKKRKGFRLKSIVLALGFANIKVMWALPCSDAITLKFQSIE